MLTGHDSFRAAADAVLRGHADLALLPIENTTAGSINETYDILAEGRLTITGEAISAIAHCVLGLPGATIADLATVMSHPVALVQCTDWIATHPHLRAEAEIDTAGAARRVRELGDRRRAAIASASAAPTYGLVVLARAVQNQAGNATRFVEVSLRPTPVPEGRAVKPSLVFALADRPGALGDLLVRIAAAGLSLTKLESRPIPDASWSYRFYVDVLGHAAARPFQQALAELGPLTTSLHVLGTYAADPQGLPPDGKRG